jgi:hypothetical protein
MVSTQQLKTQALHFHVAYIEPELEVQQIAC